MARLIVRNAARVVTMDGERRELADADVLVEDGVIRAVGDGRRTGTAEVIDAPGCVVTPGLVNTHHHLYQTPDPGGAGGAGRAALRLAEDALSDLGAVRARGHVRLGAARARRAGALGLHDELGPSLPLPERGAARGHHRGGGDDRHPLPPDARRDERRRERGRAAAGQRWSRRSRRSSTTWCAWSTPSTTARPGAMVRVGLAPCSPFSVSTGLMRDAAALARDKGVMLHTHLAENDEDIAYSLAQFGCRPGQYAEDLGWTGDHVWHAHCVKLDAGEIDLFARSRHRGRALPLLELPARLGDRAGAGDARRRGQGGARRRRLGEQRRRPPARRGAAGDAAAAGAGTAPTR